MARAPPHGLQLLDRPEWRRRRPVHTTADRRVRTTSHRHRNNSLADENPDNEPIHVRIQPSATGDDTDAKPVRQVRGGISRYDCRVPDWTGDPERAARNGMESQRTT